MAESRADRLKREAQAAKDLMDQIAALTETQRESAEMQERELTNRKRLIEALINTAQETGDLDTEMKNLAISLGDHIGPTGSVIEMQANLAKELKKVNEELEESQEALNVSSNTLWKFMGFTKDAVKEQKAFRQTILNTAESLGELTTKQGIANAATIAYAGVMQKVDELLVKSAKDVIEFGVRVDNLNKEFIKASGGAYNLSKSYFDNVEALNEFGVTMDEAQQSTHALHGSMTTLNIATEDQRTAMIEQVAIAGELGIAYEDSAQAMQNMQRIQGMGVDESIAASKEMLKFAQAMGDPKKVMSDFVKLEPQLAVFGNRANQVFKDLEMRARASGMEVDKILGLAAQFDTFEGAAEATGKLNAMLGGDFVSAMDMMEATNPAERFDMIRNSLDEAGLSYDTMGYYQKKAIAESMGLSDVNDLALMMQGSYEDMAGGVALSTEQIVEQKERAKELKTAQDAMILSAEEVAATQLRQMTASESLATAVDTAKPIIAAFASVMENLGDYAGIFLTAMLAIKGISMVATLVQLAGAFTGIGFSATAAGVGTTGAAFGFTGVEAAGWRLKLTLVLVAAAFAAIGYALFAALHSPPLYIGLFIVAAGIFAIGRMSESSVASVTAMVPAMLAMGMVVASMGIAIYMASAGVALMAEAFAQLSVAQMMGVILALAVMGVVLVALIIAIGGLGPVGIMAAVVLLAAAAAMYIAAAAIKLLAEAVVVLWQGALEPLVAFLADMFMVYVLAVVQIVDTLMEGFTNLASIIGGTVIGIIQALTEGLRALGDIILGVADALPGIVGPLATLAPFGPGLIAAGMGLGVMAASMVLMAGALQLISTDDLEALGDIMMGLGNVSQGGLPDLVGTIEDLAELADELDGELEFDVDVNINAVGAELLIKMVETLNRLQEETVENLADGIKQIARAVEEIPEEKVIRFQKVLDDAVTLSQPLGSTSALAWLADSFGGAFGGGGGGMPGRGGGSFGGKPINVNITVELDKKKVGEVVKQIMAKELSG